MYKFLKRYTFFLFFISSGIALAQDMQMVMQTGHTLPVNDLCFSPNGNYLFSTSKGVIKVWDFTNKKELKSITIDLPVVSMIALSDSTLAVLNTTSISIYDLKSGTIKSTWTSEDAVTSFDYSSKQSTFAVGGVRKLRVIKYDGKSFQESASRDITVSSVRYSFSRDSLFVASTTEMVVFDNAVHELKKIFVPGSRDLHVASAIKILFLDNKSVGITDIRNSERTLEVYGDRVNQTFNAVDISADRKYVIASNTSKFVYVWNQRGKLIKSPFFDKGIVSVEAHPSQPVVMLGGGDGKIWTYDATSKSVREELKTETLPVASVSFIDQRKSFAVIQGSNLRIYDFEGPLQVRDLTGGPGKGVSYRQYLTASATIGKDTLVTTGGDNKARVWNIATGENNVIGKGPKSQFFIVALPAVAGYFGSFYNTALLPLMAIPFKAKNTLSYLAVNEQKTIMAPGAFTGVVKTFNANSFRKKRIKPFFASTTNLSFNSDGTRASAVGENFAGRSLKIYDLSNLSKEQKIWETSENVTYATVSAIHPVKTEVAYDNTLAVNYYDYASGKHLKQFAGSGPLRFGTDHSTLFFQGPDFSIISVNSSSFNETAKFTGHSNTVKSFDFGDDKMITGSADGTARIWDLKTGKELATVVSLPDNNFIFKTPDNYYYCSKAALKLVSFTKDMKFFPFEQFDLQYNRPDIVLERLGMTSEELIHAYKRAYAKRLKKMNFSEEVFSKDFHLPEVSVRRPAAQASTRILDLHVTAKDSRYKLDRINIYVNNVPLHGSNGIDLKKQNAQHVTQTIPVELNRGKNQVLITVHNEKGVESLGETFEVTYAGNEAKPNLYVLAIGISRYEQSAMNLTYASKDAQDIANLISQRKNKFENIFVDTLLNEKATLNNILASAAKLKQSKVDDQVIVFIAGHGLLNSDLDYYIGTHDIDFLKPEEKGLAYEKLEDLLMAIPARNKVLLMDACHSGEVDKEEVMVVAANTEKVDGGQIQFRAINSKVVPRVGLQNSFELMKHLFADLRRGSGTSVVSSAGGAEYAMEGRAWKNGIFTYCMVSGLKDKKADTNKDGKVMLSELQKYLQVEVPRLTSGKQTPTSRSENLYNDVEIW